MLALLRRWGHKQLRGYFLDNRRRLRGRYPQAATCACRGILEVASLALGARSGPRGWGEPPRGSARTGTLMAAKDS